MTGEGVVIFPTGNRVVAPIDGKINFIFLQSMQLF